MALAEMQAWAQSLGHEKSHHDVWQLREGVGRRAGNACEERRQGTKRGR